MIRPSIKILVFKAISFSLGIFTVLLIIKAIQHYRNQVVPVQHSELLVIDYFIYFFAGITTFVTWITLIVEHLNSYLVVKKGQIIFAWGLKKSIKYFQVGSLVNIYYSQSLLGKLLNWGTITLQLIDTKIAIQGIDSPSQVLKTLEKQINIESLNGLRSITDITDLIKSGESENIEFKSSIRWDYRQNKVNKLLEKAIIKSIAGFMNYKGGILIVGIDDQGLVVGLKNDYGSLPKRNRDGFINHLTQLFNQNVGAQYRHLIKTKFVKKDESDILILKVSPSDSPVFVNADEQEEFWVRTGNSTNKLSIRQAIDYIHLHWQ